jgi:hypothetical protein
MPVADPDPETGASGGAVRRPSDHRLWPILIGIGLALVILVNAIFIYIAVSGADDVVPSYRTEER